MTHENKDLLRVRNNMRIARTALAKDIGLYENRVAMFPDDFTEEGLRLKWWCEQLLKNLKDPVVAEELESTQLDLLTLSEIMDDPRLGASLSSGGC